MENRKLDTWVIYRDPEEVLTALKKIVDNRELITEENPLRLYVNCYSTFIVNGKVVKRYLDTLLVSDQTDMALCLSSARYEDEDLGIISATPEDITNFLKKNDIPFQPIFCLHKENEPENIDDSNFPETWMIRERYVLEDSLNDSINKGCAECVIYPDVKSKLSIGYYKEDGTYDEIWGLNFTGLITTGNSWSFLIDEQDERNVSIEEAKQIIIEKGLSYTIGDNPFENLPSNDLKVL